MGKDRKENSVKGSEKTVEMREKTEDKGKKKMRAKGVESQDDKLWK